MTVIRFETRVQDGWNTNNEDMANRKPTEQIVLLYLELRLARNLGPATHEQILTHTGISEKSLSRALTKLRREELISRLEMVERTELSEDK